MKRFNSILATSALVLLVGACGGKGGTGTDGSTGGDGTNVNVDLAGADLVTPPTADMTKAGGKPTGDPCTANGECAASVAGTSTAPICLKMDSAGTTYKNGYCSSPCRPAKSDMATGLNPDCPSDSAACVAISQTAGQCRKACADSTTDCRTSEDYFCFNNSQYSATCFPKTADWCDPKLPMSCPKAMDGNDQLCTSYSPDESYGQCSELCDPFLQNCPAQTSGMDACLAIPSTGVASCTPAGSFTEGDVCHYLNDCAPGLACHAEGAMGICRTYCREGSGIDGGMATPDGGVFAGDYPCMSPQKCVDLSTMIKKNKLGVCTP